MSERKNRGIAAGSIGFGSVQAIVLSWTANKAIGWADHPRTAGMDLRRLLSYISSRLDVVLKSGKGNRLLF
jgi:hypothetical protein